MRVAIFTDNDFSKVNGVTTTLRAALAHAPGDVQARVYTSEDATVESPGYVALGARGVGIPFYREMKMYWPPFGRFLRRARADGVDLVHLTTPGPVGLAAMYVARRLRVPMVGSFHTDLAAYTRLLSGSPRLGRLMQEYMRWPYGRCDRVLVPSEATRLMLVDTGIRPERIRLWKRGVSTDRFQPGLREERLRREWGTGRDRPALLYAGRVSQEKGLAMLPLLSAALRASGFDHRLVIVGDGPMRADLTHACPDAVFTGTLGPGDVAAAMASADLFLFPSRTDTAGNVVLEAQASGLPVLVTDGGGAREQMVDGVTGYVCADADGFRRRILELGRDEGRRRRFSTDARAFALERNWPDALEPLYRAYRETLAARQVPGAVTPRQAVAGR